MNFIASNVNIRSELHTGFYLCHAVYSKLTSAAVWGYPFLYKHMFICAHACLYVHAHHHSCGRAPAQKSLCFLYCGFGTATPCLSAALDPFITHCIWGERSLDLQINSEWLSVWRKLINRPLAGLWCSMVYSYLNITQAIMVGWWTVSRIQLDTTKHVFLWCVKLNYVWVF